MQRKYLTAIILIAFILVLGVLIGGYFYLTNTKISKAPAQPGVSATGQLVDTTGNISSSSSTISANSTSTDLTAIPRLRQITTTPVAGGDFITLPTKMIGIEYVDRGSGNVFQTASDNVNINKISDTTIPKVYEAYIGKGGNTIIFRTLDDTTEKISTFIGSVNNSSTTGTFLPSEINSLDLTPTKDGFFAMEETPTGAQGSLYSFPTKKNIVFSSPVEKWNVEMVNSGTALLTTAPSAKTQNLSYLFNIKTKAMTELLSARNGLVVSVSPDAKYALYSQNKNDTLVSGILNIKTGVETPLSNSLIPDKCVWSLKTPSLAYCAVSRSIPTGVYPDAWYQGKVFFNDNIDTINAQTGDVESIANLQNEGKTLIDAMNLKLSPDENYHLFMNKRDLTLWNLKI